MFCNRNPSTLRKRVDGLGRNAGMVMRTCLFYRRQALGGALPGLWLMTGCRIRKLRCPPSSMCPLIDHHHSKSAKGGKWPGRYTTRPFLFPNASTPWSNSSKTHWCGLQVQGIWPLNPAWNLYRQSVGYTLLKLFFLDVAGEISRMGGLGVSG